MQQRHILRLPLEVRNAVSLQQLRIRLVTGFRCPGDQKSRKIAADFFLICLGYPGRSFRKGASGKDTAPIALTSGSIGAFSRLQVPPGNCPGLQILPGDCPGLQKQQPVKCFFLILDSDQMNQFGGMQADVLKAVRHRFTAAKSRAPGKITVQLPHVHLLVAHILMVKLHLRNSTVFLVGFHPFRLL